MNRASSPFDGSTGGDVEDAPAGSAFEPLYRAAAGLLLTGSVAAVAAVAVLFDGRSLGSLEAHELAAVWILSFLPGWLFIRFIGHRAGALWKEFVLNLHRLGVDEPQFLPEPPRSSVYYERWRVGGGPEHRTDSTIYQQKFDAFYGRGASNPADGATINGSLFPVVLATVVFALGWTALFWSGAFFGSEPDSTWDVLGYGFLGAYVFDLQMLSRRYFQSDLKPSAYASAVVRVVVVLVVVTAMHALPLFDDKSLPEQAVVAFVVGMFPLVGIQALNRLAGLVLRSTSLVKTLENPYPLSDLDGMNVWYEARLLEEGIEDMQNLVSANLVEVLLHTRVPVARLVDWLDQAHLYLRLAPRRRTGGPDRHPRDALALIGVRSATAFLTAFADGRTDAEGSPADPLTRQTIEALGGKESGLPPAVVMTVARQLRREPGLDPVCSWRAVRTSDRRRRVLTTTASVTPIADGRRLGDDDDQVA